MNTRPTLENFSNAAKAFIVKDSKLLLIKRRPNDPHGPGKWDIPGGRLQPVVDKFLSIKAEFGEQS